MDVGVLMSTVIHVVLVSTALGGIIHKDIQHTGYVGKSSGCDKVGQILINPNDACSYLVCDHGLGSSSAEHKLVARRMPCAPGTSVPPDYTKDKGSSNPCVVNTKVPCNAPIFQAAPHTPDAGPLVQSGKVNTNFHFPQEALHMMDLVWNRIEDKFKQLDHRKSLKSQPVVKLDLEKHMGHLQHLWERMRGLVGSMLQRKVRGAGKSVRKPGRNGREINGLKNLWMSMWEKIRELEALEVGYAGAEEPLGVGWEDGRTPGDEKTDAHHRERYMERKHHQHLQGKNMRYGRSKKYETNDISRFDYSDPEWDVYDKKKRYNGKDIRRPPHRPVYMDVEEEERREHGEDRGEVHHEHYQPPHEQEGHHPYREENEYGDLYPDGNVPVEHQEEYQLPDEDRYLLGEHQEGLGTVHDPLHLQYREREERQVNDNSPPHQEHQPGDYHPYDQKPKSSRQHPRRQKSGKSVPIGYRESNNIESHQAGDSRTPDRRGPPPPPLEVVDEQVDLSMVPSGFGSHMPLNTLWVQMKDVLTKMMHNNKEELKNIPTDEELEEMKRQEAHRRQYKQQHLTGGDNRYQSPPGRRREQELAPPEGPHRSHQVLSNRPPNLVNYPSARKAGSDRGPQHLSQIKQTITTPTPVTVKLPKNKQEFDELRRKDSALIDEKYENAKQQWKKISKQA